MFALPLSKIMKALEPGIWKPLLTPTVELTGLFLCLQEWGC